MPPHQSVIPVDAKREVGAEPELPALLASFPVGVVQHVLGSGAEIKDEDFDILEAAVGWGGEVCTTLVSSIGGADVPEVVVHLGTESEHALAHVVLVAPGALNGVDEVV